VQIGELGVTLTMTTGGFSLSQFGGVAVNGAKLKIYDPTGAQVTGSPFTAAVGSDNQSVNIVTGNSGGAFNPAIAGTYQIQLIVTFVNGQVLKTPIQNFLVLPSLN
jgi:hypothetical protein